MLEDLSRWCLLANSVAFELEGARNTCILTSHALVEFLRLQGLEAEVFRAEAKAFPSSEFEERLGRRACGATAGSDGDGTRRPLSVGWWGHLAVSCGEFVLDPTLDQLEAEGLRVSPVVFVKPAGWDVVPVDRPWQGGAWHDWRDGDLMVSHVRHRRQVGWKSKGAARKSAWCDVLDEMIVRSPALSNDWQPSI